MIDATTNGPARQQEVDVITVKVAPELAAQLTDWSGPVQMRLVRDGGEWKMEVRTCDITEWIL